MKKIFILVSIFLFSVVAMAENGDALVVEAKLFDNFVKNPQKPVGLAIDIFKEIVIPRIGKTNYSVKTIDVFNGCFDRLENGETDIVIGAVSKNAEREKRFDMTDAYIQADIKVLCKGVSSTFFDFISDVFFAFFNMTTLYAFLLLDFFCLFMGVIFYIAERKVNPSFTEVWNEKNSKVKALDECISRAKYFMNTVASTIGFGDITPATRIGRRVVAVARNVGIPLFGAFVATVAISFAINTKADIVNIKDLQGEIVAVVSGTHACNVVSNSSFGVKIKEFVSLDLALLSLKEGKVKAVIHDEPPLKTYAQSNPRFALAPFSIQAQSYGFVVQQGSSLREKINLALAEARESGLLDYYIKKWYPER